MIESVNKSGLNSFHLAGIVPIAGQPLEFGFPWHPSLNPLDVDYLAIERAVYECAMAGSETIWVVCHREVQPLVKKTVGEWIVDPCSGQGPMATDTIRRIPIYYVPIHPKDRNRRDCLGWSALYGALSAYWISRKMSKWLIPDMYYTAFPYGVYPVEFLREHRRDISSRKKFLLKSEGKTIKDGLPLGFTFDGEDFKNCRRNVREESINMFGPDGKKLPIKKRYTARHFPLDKVFEGVIIGENSKLAEVPWFYDISTWCGYKDYIASGKKLDKYKEMKYNEWRTIDWCPYSEEDTLPEQD